MVLVRRILYNAKAVLKRDIGQRFFCDHFIFNGQCLEEALDNI
jgi:hypothetical protein